MSISLKQLRAFLFIAKTKSFTITAEKLFVTQPAVSGLIKDLETTLGVKLIDRSTQKIELSRVGEEFLPLIEKSIHDLDSVIQKIRDRNALQLGTVHLAAPQLLASTLLPAVIAKFQENYPNITVKLQDTSVESIIHKVFSGEVDIGVGPDRETGSEIKASPLFEGQFMAVFPREHPLREYTTIPWETFLQYPLITLQGQFSEKLLLDLRAHDKHLYFEAKNEVAFMSTALAMVNCHLGVATCMRYALHLVSVYELELRPLVQPVLLRRFCTFVHQTRSLTPEASCFLTFLEAYVRENRELLG